jgi:predicted LPLAT superfamily acyltransferase
MEWYKVKEKSAGKKRLILTWYLYKLLGRKVALVIAFFVAFITFCTNKDLRKYSLKYFEILYNYTNIKKLKPTLLNAFKHSYAYAESLVYKMEAFAGRYKSDCLKFTNNELKQELFSKINNKEGILFICNHIGNIDILKTFLTNNKYAQPTSISIFLQKEHCTTFNNFINSIGIKYHQLNVYPIEEINLGTISEIDDNLKNGGIAFIAGDRIAANNPDRSLEVSLLGRKILLPIGTFKFAQILKYNTYFISAIKNKKDYEIYMEKTDLQDEKLIEKFTLFIEKIIMIAPYQFFHFYDIFVE